MKLLLLIVMSVPRCWSSVCFFVFAVTPVLAAIPALRIAPLQARKAPQTDSPKHLTPLCRRPIGAPLAMTSEIHFSLMISIFSDSKNDISTNVLSMNI
ncbi:hypothetical protein [Limnohabitans planktonicus]|uniref:hypothetical protein n=1 Tax=Limnohabitans planktonicus TaxID=540060 RepID=UPI00105812C2|nr:hypothetical protein [Limnohabitans planktonicus]